MRKSLYLILIAVLMATVLSACGMESLRPIEADSPHPHVLSVTPGEGEAFVTVPSVVLNFSKPLLASTITKDTVFVITRDVYDSYDTQDWSDLYDDVQDGDVAIVPGEITLSEDQTQITFNPLSDVEDVGEYVIVALPRIQSTDYYPLNQTVVGDLYQQFESSFLVANAETAAQNEAQGGGVDESASDGFNSSSTSDSTTSASSETADSSVNETLELNTDRVFITEVVTDAQQDHNESSYGNGTHFDMHPGRGTVGSTDEYIEIYNGTAEDVDLTSWSLAMLDGSDVTQMIEATTWDMSFSKGGSIQDFNSGEVLVLGNPDGDMKNSLVIDLLDETGMVQDEVYVDDANATGLTDEAYQLDEFGGWSLDAATPGEVDF